MKTYNTYQEAKIANQKSTICKFGDKFTNDTNRFGQALQPANPADHCMTVEQFLKARHKFVVGDLIYNTHPYDKVDEIELKDLHDYCDLDCDDNKRYILRAVDLDKPETTEWKNGDKCQHENGVVYTFIGECDNPKQFNCVLMDGFGNAVLSFINELSKTESQEEKEKRERLEAAYDLYSSWASNSYGEPLFCFKAFCDTPELCTKWLAIVDKTNYRKGE